MHMICDIATSLEANPGSILKLHKCDVEARSPHCTYTEAGDK